MPSFWRDDIDPDHDPHKVLIVRDKLFDESRDNRPVKIKIYYPVNHNMTDLPVIIWSHGLGGSVDGAAFLSRFLAAQGFVMVHVQHHGTDTTLWEGKKGHPWDVIRKAYISRAMTLNRFADIPFVLDQLPAWMGDHPEVAEHADLSMFGMSGHSFGALTSQVMAGMLFPDEDEKLVRLKEARFQAGILYSPGPIEHLGNYDPAEIYGAIDIPLFHMTGTDDKSPVSGWDYKKRLSIYENSPKVEKNLLVLKDGDHMVFSGSRGKLGKSPHREEHERIIKIAALAYWEATLKQDKAAQEWLTEGGFSSYLGKQGTFK